VAYVENFREGGIIQWHMVIICIWCTLCVTSQFYVIFMFPNQRLGEVWHVDICIFLYTYLLPLFYVWMHWI